MRLIDVDDLPKFPTMLRKMWSGGEVQQWIDENIVAHKDATMPQQVQQALTLFSEEIKQLCNDFSSRTGNVYIKDVEACLDEILKQSITNAPTVQYKLSKDEQIILKEAHINSVTKMPPTVQHEGWKLVPIEPTEEMLRAGCEAGLDFKTLMDDTPYATDLATYKAMISAAPDKE